MYGQWVICCAGEDVTEANDPTRDEEIAFEASKQEEARGDDAAGSDEEDNDQ